MQAVDDRREKLLVRPAQWRGVGREHDERSEPRAAGREAEPPP